MRAKVLAARNPGAAKALGRQVSVTGSTCVLRFPRKCAGMDRMKSSGNVEYK